jgi:hypothetical protein
VRNHRRTAATLVSPTRCFETRCSVAVASVVIIASQSPARAAIATRRNRTADHFIAIHLSEMPYAGVYAKVSAASMAKPTDAALAAEVQTVFRGTTLRGLLFEAYGFSVLGTIALWAAIASFVLAGLMALHRRGITVLRQQRVERPLRQRPGQHRRIKHPHLRRPSSEHAQRVLNPPNRPATTSGVF